MMTQGINSWCLSITLYLMYPGYTLLVLMNIEKALRSVLAFTHVYVVKFDILSFKILYNEI